MAHSPQESLPDFPGFPQSKTLFTNSQTTRAILRIPDGEKFRSEPMVFDDPHLALNWCLAHGASLVLQNEDGDPSAN